MYLAHLQETDDKGVAKNTRNEGQKKGTKNFRPKKFMLLKISQ